MDPKLDELVEEFIKEIRVKPPPALMINLGLVSLRTEKLIDDGSNNNRFIHPKKIDFYLKKAERAG